jgi:hypothetical protein
MTCTRCESTGFLNTDQLPEGLLDHGPVAVLKWMSEHPESDVMVCDCCGNGETWYGVPGEHYTADDPRGPNGPYAHNGGLARCN